MVLVDNRSSKGSYDESLGHLDEEVSSLIKCTTISMYSLSYFGIDCRSSKFLLNTFNNCQIKLFRDRIAVAEELKRLAPHIDGYTCAVPLEKWYAKSD